MGGTATSQTGPGGRATLIRRPANIVLLLLATGLIIQTWFMQGVSPKRVATIPLTALMADLAFAWAVKRRVLVPLIAVAAVVAANNWGLFASRTAGLAVLVLMYVAMAWMVVHLLSQRPRTASSRRPSP